MKYGFLLLAAFLGACSPAHDLGAKKGTSSGDALTLGPTGPGNGINFNPSPSVTPTSTLTDSAQFLQTISALGSIPGNSAIRVWRNHSYTDRVAPYTADSPRAANPDRRVMLDLYYSAGQNLAKPVILFIHGGVLVHGSKAGDYKYTVTTKKSDGTPDVAVTTELICDSNDDYQTNPNCQCPAAPLATQGYVVACMNYHLMTNTNEAGEKYLLLTQLLEAKLAIQYLNQNAARLGILPNMVSVWGVDIGGYIAMMIGATSKAPTQASVVPGYIDSASTTTDSEGNSIPVYRAVSPVKSVISFSGAYDPTLFPHFFNNAGKNDSNVFDQRLSPIFQLQSRGGNVPMFLVHGQADYWSNVPGQSTTVDMAVKAKEFVASVRQINANYDITYQEIVNAPNAQFRGLAQTAPFWRFNSTTNANDGIFSSLLGFVSRNF